MNVLRVAVLLSTFAVAVSRAADTNALPTTITIDSVTYENVTWKTVTPNEATIYHKTGIARIPMAKLPPEIQNRLGFSPESKQAETAKAKVEAERAAAEQVESLRGTLAYLDARYGFRDLKFGQSISQCKGMQLARTDSETRNLKTYRRQSDELKIGDVTLSGIEYVFYKDCLMEVRIAAGSEDTALDGIENACTTLYGEWTSTDQPADLHGNVTKEGEINLEKRTKSKTYSWDGKRVHITLDNMGYVVLNMYSIEIYSQYEADLDAEEKIKANKGANGL